MFEEREVYLSIKREREKVEGLLNALNLKLPKNIDYTVGIYYGEDLVGTGSLVGDILQGIAINPDYQGEGISAKIVSSLIKELWN